MTTGLYRGATEDSFATLETIKKEQLEKQHEAPVYLTPLPNSRSFEYWSQRLQERQKIYRETNENLNVIRMAFAKPPLVCFMSDQHIQAPETDYARIDAEINAIAETPNAFLWGVGDITDNFFWLPAGEDKLEPREEAIEYAKSALRFLADKKKLLIMTAGNHDLFSTRTGVDPFKYISQELGAYYTHGDTYLYADVNGIEYKIMANHQWQGQSIYNNAHPEVRAGRSIEGADVIVGGHYHQKGIVQQPVHEFGNSGRVVTYMALGTYKASDEWTRTKGFARRTPDEMYGSAVFLSGTEKMVDPHYDIVEACRKFSEWQE